MLMLPVPRLISSILVLAMISVLFKEVAAKLACFIMEISEKVFFISVLSSCFNQ